jgi:Flp pilus assembly protein TadG
MRGLFRRLRDDGGSTIVEMAVSCVLFVAVLFGVFEGCLASYTYHLISEVAREGSRWAIVRGSDCHKNTPGLDNCGADQTAISSYVKSLSFPGIDSSSRMAVTAAWYTPGATAACTTQCNQPGNTVQITVNYSFPFAVPFIPRSTIRIGSSSRMVISQ